MDGMGGEKEDCFLTAGRSGWSGKILVLLFFFFSSLPLLFFLFLFFLVGTYYLVNSG